MADFLYKVQEQTEDLGKSLKRIRKAKGMKQFSLIGRAIERGESVLDNGKPITVQHLIGYCTELNIGLVVFNRDK